MKDRKIKVVQFESGILVNHIMKMSFHVEKDHTEIEMHPNGVLIKQKDGDTWVYAAQIRQVDLYPDETKAGN